MFWRIDADCVSAQWIVEILEHFYQASAAEEAAIGDILHFSGDQFAFVVEMQVASNQGLDQRLVFHVFDELVCREVWLLLFSSSFVVAGHFLGGATADVGAPLLASHHHLLIQVRGIDWIVHQQKDWQPLCDFRLQRRQLAFPKIVVAIVKSDKIHAADNTRGKFQVIFAHGLDKREGLVFVIFVLPCFSDVLAELVVAGTHEIIHLVQKGFGGFHILVRDEVDQIARMQHQVTVMAAVIDHFGQGILNAVGITLEDLVSFGGQEAFSLVIAFVCKCQMIVGRVQETQRLGQSDFDSGMDVMDHCSEKSVLYGKQAASDTIHVFWSFAS